MKFLLSIVVVASAITFAIVSGRSANLPERKVTNDDENVIILEVPVSGDDDSASKKGVVDGDKLLLKGKNFTSLKEMVNILEEDKKGRSSDVAATTEFSIVVPVARNFSSLKELFEILREDDARSRKPTGVTTSTKQAYVKGTQANASDYMIFFTS